MKKKFNRDDKIAGILMILVGVLCIYFMFFDRVDVNKIQKNEYNTSKEETARPVLSIKLDRTTINNLIDMCNEVDKDIDIEKVELTTTINNTGEYVDEYAITAATVTSESEYELGAIYFSDSILLRYINGEKKFKTIVAGQEVRTGTDIFREVTYKVADINGLDSIYGVIQTSQEDTSLNNYMSSLDNFDENNLFRSVTFYPSINTYRYNIYDLLSNIEELEVENQDFIESHCTYSGYEEIRSVAKNIQRINIIEAGTTNVDVPTLNRVLVQYTDNADNLKAIILKINSDGLIYDIDSLN